jgi:hypothetical protein
MSPITITSEAVARMSSFRCHGPLSEHSAFEDSVSIEARRVRYWPPLEYRLAMKSVSGEFETSPWGEVINWAAVSPSSPSMTSTPSTAW